MTASVRTGATIPDYGPELGFAVQFGVLGGLAGEVGLGWAGWLAGTGFAVGTFVTLRTAWRRSGRHSFGPANQVTLARATLVGGVTALVAKSIFQPVPVAVLVTLALVALVLDGVDGYVARHTGSVSALGARFDMEVDAFLIMVLSVAVSRTLGGWVLAIGLLRYAFVLAGRGLPWLRAGLPPRYGRKVVATMQGAVLVTAASGLLPGWLATLAVAAALATLVWSFGRDTWWLWRTRRPAVRQPASSDLAASHSALRPG